MPSAEAAHLQNELAQRVLDRTGRRVRNLRVEYCDERVILRGQTASYYVKQLAQHGVRDLLPNICLENVIVVEKDEPAAV